MPELVRPDGSQPAEKFCPYLPPIPVMSKVVQGRLDGFIFTDCQLDKCRVYDACQGKHSPAARGAKTDSALRGMISALRGFPMMPQAGKDALDAALVLLTGPQATA